MQAPDQILDVIRAHRAELRHCGVRRLGLFGSAARGEATDASDLDFLVEFDHKTFDAYMDVKELLERLFQRRIDLVVAEAVKPQLRPRILRETIYAEDFRVSLQDVLQAIADVGEFIGAMTKDEFQGDKKTLHAVVRNLEVVGEATKAVPSSVRDRHPQVPWQRIAGLRDILIHHYFGIDIDIVWDIVQNKLPELKRYVEAILADPGEDPAA